MEKKTKKDDNEAPTKNKCAHCKKIQRRKPLRVNPDKCMWNKKYNNTKCKAIDSAHGRRNKPNIGLAQPRRNTAYSMSLAFNRTFKKLNKTTWHVSFASHNSVRLFNNHTEPIMITYDSGADDNYISKRDCVKAGLPILQQSTRKVGVANGGTSLAKHVTRLLFNKLSARAWQADTFQDFLMSLMSVGTTADDSTVYVFAKTGILVYIVKDVLITCKGKPILIKVRDKQGRYQIPLMQQQGQWQPRCPSKQAQKALQ
jgi:hypothetical protein